MIQITLTIEEHNGIASARAETLHDGATPLELSYLETIVPSLGRENNPVHTLAATLAEKIKKGSSEKW